MGWSGSSEASTQAQFRENLNHQGNAPRPFEEADPSEKGKSVVTGLLCAIGCGLLNGSLMVPMTCFQNGSSVLGVSKYGGGGLAPIAFLPSLSIGIIIVQPVF